MAKSLSCALVIAMAIVFAEPPASVFAGEARGLSPSFPLGVYWPWERTEALAKRNGLEKWAFVERCLDDLKARSCDAVWVVNLGIPDLPGLARRMDARGMKLVPALAELHYNLDWRRNNWTYLEKESRRALEAAGRSPAILAWALCDEPRRDLLGEMETFRRKFVEWGSRQPAVVVTMWPDSPAYAERAGFAAVCTDLYSFFSAGNPNGPNTPSASRAWYCRQVQITAEAARKATRPAWIMPQCFVEIWGPWKYDERLEAVLLPGAILHWRAPTVGETRWQVWSALAAGAQGFFWYVYLPPPDGQPEAKPYVGPTFPATLAVKEATPVHAPGGLIRADGSATPQYLAVAEAFQAVKRLVPVLRDTVPASSPVGEASSPGRIEGLADPERKRTFAVVVNDDTDREQTLRVRLRKLYEVRDLRSGQVLQLGTDNMATMKLGPGDGTLLELLSIPDPASNRGESP
jgi:hypothetical protein